jgi:hypothetical protein
MRERALLDVRHELAHAALMRLSGAPSATIRNTFTALSCEAHHPAVDRRDLGYAEVVAQLAVLVAGAVHEHLTLGHDPVEIARGNGLGIFDMPGCDTDRRHFLDAIEMAGIEEQVGIEAAVCLATPHVRRLIAEVPLEHPYLRQLADALRKGSVKLDLTTPAPALH